MFIYANRIQHFLLERSGSFEIEVDNADYEEIDFRKKDKT